MDPTTLGVATIVIGAVVALLVGCATVWAARRYGSHRGRLDIDVRNLEIQGRTRLIDQQSGEVIAEADTADAPGPTVYIVQLRIRNRGFHDIAEDAFNNKPLVLSLGGADVAATGSFPFLGGHSSPRPGRAPGRYALALSGLPAGLSGAVRCGPVVKPHGSPCPAL